MAHKLVLPKPGGDLETYALGAPGEFPARPKAPFNRVAFAAAHVVADPLATGDPWIDPMIDWERTLAFRHHLWDLGLAVAEAMDTAQRGMGLGWRQARELIGHSLHEAAGRSDARLACGVGTDHLQADDARSLDDIIRAYEEQIEAVEALGGQLIVMSSRALARVARSPDDYAAVYDRILANVRQPVIIHWLGDMFDPELAGYWGHADHHAAMDVCLEVIAAHAARVDGIKLSLLDKDKELRMRARLPAKVRMYTGDDFNFAELIAGDEVGYSDALLGIFDAIAPAASAALGELSSGNLASFHDILAPTVPLSRHIFAAPTRFYKTGIVFLAYLNGHQDHFVMVGGQESARSALHLAELIRLADRAGLLRDPALAARRAGHVFAAHGIEQG